jgi:tRNA modification GTPase
MSLLTPPGRGAVATLLVEGPGAAEAVEALFRAIGGQPLGSLPQDRLLLGHIGGERGEEVVLRRRSPQSIELHCHGGLAAVDMVQRLLAEQGCRPSTWQEWAAQTLADPIQLDALLALAEARTARTAAILLDQYHGSLRRAIEGIRQSLAAGDVPGAREGVEKLLRRANLGRHLTRPWQVVLTGPPNAGKSSLMNALVGYQRAIVDPLAGTTRDVVSATTALDGWPVEFSDTAGVRPSDIPLERGGILLAEAKVSSADLVVLVFDASQAAFSEAGIPAPLERRPDVLVVYNKRDLVADADPRSYPGLLTSALSGEGIGELARNIAARLVPDAPNPGEAVLFTHPQIERIETLETYLSGGNLAGALALLAQVGGMRT